MSECRGRALIAEDDESIRGLLATLLQRSGFSVQLAADGRQALAMLDEDRFDVLLLDLTMPLVDGTAVIEYLQQSKRELIEHTIVLSARPPSSLEDIAHSCRVMSKPFDISELMGAVCACAVA